MVSIQLTFNCGVPNLQSSEFTGRQVKVTAVHVVEVSSEVPEVEVTPELTATLSPLELNVICAWVRVGVCVKRM